MTADKSVTTPSVPWLDLNDADDLEIEIAHVKGRVQSHRRWISVQFLDRRDFRSARRQARIEQRRLTFPRLCDIEDSIGAHWRLMHHERRKLAKLRVRLANRPALMQALRDSVDLADEPVSARAAMLCAPLGHAAE